MQKRIVLVLKRALKVSIKLINKLRPRKQSKQQQPYIVVKGDPCELKENAIRCTKRKRVPEANVEEPIVPEVPSCVPEVPSSVSEVPISVPEVAVKPTVVSVYQCVTIRELAYIIEIRKKLTRERPQKRVSEKIAALVLAIETRNKKTAIALPAVEELALDDFFAWAMVPMLQLDEFFAWAQVPVLHLDEFFNDAEVDMLYLDEFFAENEEEQSLVKVEQVKSIPRSCSFDTLQIITRGSIHSHSCPEMFMLMA